NEDLAVLLRKLAECPGDLLGQLLAQHATLRVGPQAPRDEAGVDALELPARRLVELLAVALAGPEPIDGQGAGDPVQPGIEGRIALERVQTLVHPQEGVLGDVHGLLPILDQREGDREHLSLVAKYERAESLIVPGLASAYQRKVVQLQPGTPLSTTTRSRRRYSRAPTLRTGRPPGRGSVQDLPRRTADTKVRFPSIERLSSGNGPTGGPVAPR